MILRPTSSLPLCLALALASCRSLPPDQPVTAPAGGVSAAVSDGSAAGVPPAAPATFDRRLFMMSAGDSNRVFKLSHADAVARALARNTAIQIRRIEPGIRNQDVRIAEAAFEPAVSASLTYRDNTLPPGADARVAGSLETRSTDAAAGIGGKLPTGTRYAVEVAADGRATEPEQEPMDPVHTALPRLVITQPLLRGAGTGVNRAETEIAVNRWRAAQQAVRETTMAEVSESLRAYLTLHVAIERQALAVAAATRVKELLDINRARYAKGLVSSVDILETDAALAQRARDLIAAEAAVHRATDLLKHTTGMMDTPELWNARLTLSDRPVTNRPNTDLTAALETAFRQRPDYLAKRFELLNRDIQLRVADDARLPTLDLAASLGSNGIGDDFPEAFRTCLDGYEDWSVGLTLTVPWGGADGARRDQRRLEKAQALLELKRLEQSLVLSIRDRVRDTDIRFRQMEASRLLLDKERANYLAQEQRHQAGQISAHDMLSYQDQLASAEVGLLESTAAYQESLIDLDRAQGLTLERWNIALEE